MGIAAPESPSWCLEEILHYYTSVPAWFPSETVGSTYDSHFRSLQPFSPGSVSNWTVGPLLLDNQILPSGPIPVDLKRCSVHPVPKKIPGEMQASQQKAVHRRQQRNLDFKIWRGRSQDRKVSIKLSLNRRFVKPANVTTSHELLLHTRGAGSFHSWPSEVPTHWELLEARIAPSSAHTLHQVTATWPMPSMRNPGVRVNSSTCNS